MEGFSSGRWALPSGYRCAGLGGQPFGPEARWTFGPGYSVELAGGDRLATSRSDLLGFRCSGLSTRLETRTKESNMDANVNSGKLQHAAKTNNYEVPLALAIVSLNG